MRFDESEFIDMTNIPKVFVYFLIDNGEVVYVGKTTVGLSRIYAHKDKKYDKVYIILCDPEDLDFTETKYIAKYLPKYNTVFNTRGLITTHEAISKIRKLFKLSEITPLNLNEMLATLNSETINCNGITYMREEDFETIVCEIDGYTKGAPVNEVFNIRI